jgi:acetate---CoA ligase (ADP-forming)
VKDLGGLLHARSVCLVGASADTARTAGQPLQLLLKHGYRGRIVCVNPKYAEIAGQPCHPSVADLPEPVDAALVTLPAALVPDVVRQCGLRGIRHVVVLSAGFEETEQGRELGAAVARHAAEYGVTVVGPNSEGLWSPSSRLLLTHGTAANRDTVIEGPVTVLSQSGSIGAGVVRQLQDCGVGCRYFVSLGNETVLTLCDCVEWMVEEGGSRVILLFIEGLSEGARLVDAARRAAARGIAVVALKAGASAAGREATASHTGKMASSARVYSSLFRQAGILEVATLSELVEAGEVLSLPAPRQCGPRIAVLSASGGCRALIADAAEAGGLSLPPFAPSTQVQVEKLMDGLGVATNPTDVPVTALYDPQRFAALVRALADDDRTDALLVQYANRGLRQVGEHVDLFGEVGRRTGKAVAVSFLGDLAPAELRLRLRQAGVLCAREPAQAVRQLGWLQARAAAGKLAPRHVVESRGAASAATLDWQAQLDLLGRSGVAVPSWRAVGPDQDPRHAAGDLNFPVVVKAFPQDADHKAEAGLVLVGLRDAQAMAEAVATVRSRLPAGACVLVQEMVPGGVEALLAARVDPDFGPVLAIGTGGTAVEWLADVAYLALPVDAAEVGRALDTLMLGRLLPPFRGRAAADRQALVAAACRLGDVFLASGLQELEVNPLFVRAQGQGVVAVDVLTR